MAVWELTMACNMRCLHCGSACAEALPDELSPEEALQLCDDLVESGLLRLTLSGGEPLLRKDWDAIARRLSGQGVEVSMLSNGWLMNRSTIDRARSAGLRVIGVSLDGIEETHDHLRRKGAFRRVLKALAAMRELDFPSAVVTTIMKRNLTELEGLRKILIAHGVRQWQLQFGNPMGNLADHREELIEPRDVPAILNFAAQVSEEGHLRVDLADCLGYFTRIDTKLRQTRFFDRVTWQGCGAGKYVVGIRHNGDICGCNSIREEGFIEGNVRAMPLEELWTRPGAFSWNRGRTRSSLRGFCRLCQYGDLCLAGCTGTRRTLGRSDGEYRYCAYRIAIENLFPKIDAIRDPRVLAERAEKAVELGLPEVAHRCLTRAAAMEPHSVRLRDRLALVAGRITRAQTKDPQGDGEASLAGRAHDIPHPL